MIVVTGDVHLSSSIWMRHPRIRGDAEKGFQFVVDWASERDADALILAGDIMDPPSSKNLDLYHKILGDFPGLVAGIQGQHDHADPSWLSVEGVRDMDINNEAVDINGITFYGVEYQPRVALACALEGVPPIDFLVMHQLAEPCIDFGSADFNPEQIPQHVQAAVCGDLHQQTEFSLSSGGKGYYTGSLTPRNRREIGNGHGFLVIDDNKQVRRINYTGRMFDRLILEEEEDFERLAAAKEKLHRRCGMPPALFVDFNPDLSGSREKLNEFKSNNPDMIVVVKPRPQKGADASKGSAIASVDLESGISEAVDDPLTEEFLVNVTSHPSLETIDKFREQHFEGVELAENA